jgi:Tol biopolymer transport system component/PKD repeat protein
LLALISLGAAVTGCRDANPSLGPTSDGPRFSHTPGQGLEGKITFQSNRNGNFDIFVMNADGSGVTQLTSNPLDEYLPMFSPDGSRITFGRCLSTCDIVVINADGSGERTILNDGFPGAWSPDGNRIVLGRGDGIFIINADGSGLVRVLEPDFVTDWSPDGRQLMIVSGRDGDLELYATPLDGSPVTKLTDNTASDNSGTGWSPDGTRIVFCSDRDGDREIFVMNADGSNVQQLTQNGIDDGCPVWSPDGTQIAFDRVGAGDQQIFVMNADGSGVTQLTFDAGVINSGPHWIRQVFPANDDFANATGISGLPFGEVANLTLASTEAGEQTPSCSSGSSNKTVWYSFTPPATGSVSASIINAAFSTVVAAYTGNSLADLTPVGCRAFGGKLTFRAEAGTTYYFQVDGMFGGSGPLEFLLEVTPAPTASFYFFPGDPTIFDVVQFNENSFDPGEVGIESRQWAFGDGTTTTTADCCVTHRYGTDGSYTVQLTVTTVDSRTGSITQTVVVRTHDVAITKFSVPKSASAGQTRQIVVGLNSRRYPETVEVQLFKSVPGGYQQVGSLTQSVPVRAANRTTDFSFSYTFTGADAQVGKVTFRAVANILGVRDALPADDEAIAPPTKVSR